MIFELIYIFFLACLIALIFISSFSLFFKIKKSIDKNHLKKSFKLIKGEKE